MNHPHRIPRSRLAKRERAQILARGTGMHEHVEVHVLRSTGKNKQRQTPAEISNHVKKLEKKLQERELDRRARRISIIAYLLHGAWMYHSKPPAALGDIYWRQAYRRLAFNLRYNKEAKEELMRLFHNRLEIRYVENKLLAGEEITLKMIQDLLTKHITRIKRQSLRSRWNMLRTKTTASGNEWVKITRRLDKRMEELSKLRIQTKKYGDKKQVPGMKKNNIKIDQILGEMLYFQRVELSTILPKTEMELLDECEKSVELFVGEEIEKKIHEMD